MGKYRKYLTIGSLLLLDLLIIAALLPTAPSADNDMTPPTELPVGWDSDHFPVNDESVNATFPGRDDVRDNDATVFASSSGKTTVNKKPTRRKPPTKEEPPEEEDEFPFGLLKRANERAREVVRRLR